MPDKFIKFTFLLLVALDSMLASPVAKSDDAMSGAKREAVKEILAIRQPVPQYNGVPPQGVYPQNQGYNGGYQGGYQQNPGYAGGAPYQGGYQQNTGYGQVPYPDYGVPYPGGNQQYPNYQSGGVIGNAYGNPYFVYNGNYDDPCGLKAYYSYYGSSPCDDPRSSGYFKVIDNPYYFVQCGSGSAHCQPCGPGTEWDQSSKTCGYPKSG